LESIQQSPIDPLMVDETSRGVVTPELAALLEERPWTPPMETHVEGTVRLRLLNPQVWADQICSSGIKGANGVVVSRSNNGGIVATRHPDGLCMSISADGLCLKHNGEIYKLSDQVEQLRTVPLKLLQLMTETYEIISNWRSRVVRLSMDTDEYECSLMDDICPPRTFLVELKIPSSLKSIRIQAGVSYWQMSSGKIATVPVSLLEEQECIAKFMHRLVPELDSVDVLGVWSDVVQLRGMCLDEDRRLMSRPQIRAPISGG
jgi:hypothetical protein